MGENGAGKSTLMKILMGIYTKDSGEVIFDGKPYEVANQRGDGYRSGNDPSGAESDS